MTLRVEPSLVRVRDSGHRSAGHHHRQPAGAPGPGGCSSAVGTRNGWCISPSPHRRSTCFAGELGRARLRIEAPPPPAGQESSQSADRAGDVARARRTCEVSRDVRPDDLGRAGGHPGDAAAGSQRRPGPGHRRRATGSDHRQPRRHPGAPGLPVRARPGTAGQIHLLAAVAGRAARRDRPGPGAAGGAAARARARRPPGRSRWSPRTAPGRSRPAGPSSRSPRRRRSRRRSR